MTLELFRTDSRLVHTQATITALDPAGLVLDRTVFYPLGGGQAGDTGTISLPNGSVLRVADTRKHKDAEGALTGQILHVIDTAQAGLLESVDLGTPVSLEIDWQRRHRLMRFHTATHLLCHLVPLPVNGCSITPEYARLDFHMTEPLDKDVLTQGLSELVAGGYPVHIESVTDAELDARPELVKSMSVSPPRGTGQVRTVRIGCADGEGGALIDLQPCGGTHVANTSEIGRVTVSKIEKKSANTRRVVLALAD